MRGQVRVEPKVREKYGFYGAQICCKFVPDTIGSTAVNYLTILLVRTINNTFIIYHYFRFGHYIAWQRLVHLGSSRRAFFLLENVRPGAGAAKGV